MPEVIFSEEPSSTTAIARLEAGEIDVYAFSITDPDIFQQVLSTAALDYERNFGSYAEITFNPVGPTFANGKLNPFSVPAVREAINWLIDREYIAEEIYGGMALPRYLPINSAFPDYVRLIDVARALELKYAPDFDRAQTVIAAEMAKLGAQLVNGKWQYNNSPVEIIMIIRTEDERREVGDYLGTLLENVGFTVDRQFKTSGEASPIWIQSNPADGLYHVYTGGWVTTAISRDQAGNLDFFYTNRGLAFPLWQAYTPAADFDAVSTSLATRDFTTIEERTELFAQGLELAMKDSVRVWTIDQIGISPRKAGVNVAADLAGGIYGAQLWAQTLRHADGSSAAVKVSMPSIIPEVWNPLDGSNWVYDTMIYRGTGDFGTMPDPFTGLWWPQRIEKADVVIKEGLPVGATLDWVNLSFADEIQVPTDAWSDWNAAEQRFITVAERYPDGVTALRKSVVYYPGDLYDIKWHDGSQMSIADFVMGIILSFDRAKEESAIHDPATVPAFNTFMRMFRGVKIVSESPLVIETYSDLYYLDAEWNVATWFPYFLRGQGAWHNLGIGIMAEADEELSFSRAKAQRLDTEWMNYIAGPSLEVLAGKLTTAAAQGHVPYEPTLGEYLGADEIAARWANLGAWYEQQGHFWIGTGPFYLEKVFPVEKVVQLKRNADYPDLSEKWARFSEPMIAEVDVEGPANVKIGAEAVFDVEITFKGQAYRQADIDAVKYLVFNALGELVFVGDAQAVEDGHWRVTLTAEQTAGLSAGVNRLEIAVASFTVSIPSFASMEFISAP